MISEQTATRTPTRTLRVRPFAETGDVADVTGSRSKAWESEGPCVRIRIYSV